MKYYLCLFFFCILLPGTANERIVSLAPSISETLDALGAENQVIGKTNFCQAFPNAKAVGNITHPNPELILAQNPTLVAYSSLTSSFSLTFLKNINTLYFEQDSIPKLEKDILMLGVATGHIEEAKTLIRTLQIETLSSSLKGKRCLILIDIHSKYAAGQHTFLGDIIQKMGGINVTHTLQAPWPQLSLEAIIHLNPEVIFIGSHASLQSIITPAIGEEIKADPFLRSLKGKIYWVDSNYLTTPGPKTALLINKLQEIGDTK